MPTGVAHANIALVKYWGKRNAPLNLPATGSLSVTLDALTTRTSVDLADSDGLSIDGREITGEALAKVQRFLDLIAGAHRAPARVVSTTNFPVGAGLASSAAAFAALAVAGTAAYGHGLTPRELSVLARRGSGSAARSIFGGFVRMHAGTREDGTDAFAEPIPAKLSLAAAIAVAPHGAKEISSTRGMEHTRETSPYHAAWLAAVESDLVSCERALALGDFEALALVAEGSALAMHADAMAARPGILYFGPSTLLVIQEVRALRKQGIPVFFTIDAGPHVVAFTPPEHLDAVIARLTQVPGIVRVMGSQVGGDARLEGV